MNFQEIDKLIEEACNCSYDDDRFHTILSKIRVEYSPFAEKVNGVDPFSTEYIKEMEKIHRMIIGKEYSYSYEGVGEEESDKFKDTMYCDYPYSSTLFTTRLLHAYADILLAIDLPFRASILEPGCGMGSLTELLVRMNYQVDAIDVNEDQCLMTERRINLFNKTGSVICSDLESFLKSCEKKYDAVLFFESFHHFMNHYQILESIKNRNLQTTGKIILSGEPILPNNVPPYYLPYPWGPRFDGESMYQMRTRGWLEMGFKESYIREMAEKLKMKLTYIPSQIGPHGTVWILENK